MAASFKSSRKSKNSIPYAAIVAFRYFYFMEYTTSIIFLPISSAASIVDASE